MSTSVASIVREQKFSDIESLVHIREALASGETTHYIAIAVAPPGEAVRFTAAEQVLVTTADRVFNTRTIFNGSRRSTLSNNNNSVLLDAKRWVFAATAKPTRRSP